MSKNYFIVILFLIFLSSCGTSRGTEEVKTIVEAPPIEVKEPLIVTKKIKKLSVAPNGEIYVGAFADFGHSEHNVTIKKIENFEKLAKKQIAFATISNNWSEGIIYPKEIVHVIDKTGATPLIRLMPRSNNKQLGGQKDSNFSLDKIVNGTFDKKLKKWALDAKKDDIPLLLDFAPEMTGEWFSWNGKYYGAGKLDGYGDPTYPDGPEVYRDAYRHIIDLFREQNVSNITWFFHPDIQRLPGDPAYQKEDYEWNSAKYYYPGDEYIDWIGFSIYGVQNEKWGWVTFSETLKKWYDIHIKELLEVADKPVAILEMGVTDGRKDGTKKEWLEDAFATILDNPYITVSAINYWHENWITDSGVIAKLKIDSSKESLETFQKLISNPRFISKTNFIEE